MLLLVLVLVVGVLAAFFNPGNVTINYGLGSGEFPISFIIGGIFIIGTLFGYLIAGLSILRWRTSAHRWQNKAESALAEVNNLRRIPLKNQ